VVRLLIMKKLNPKNLQEEVIGKIADHLEQKQKDYVYSYPPEFCSKKQSWHFKPLASGWYQVSYYIEIKSFASHPIRLFVNGHVVCETYCKQGYRWDGIQGFTLLKFDGKPCRIFIDIGSATGRNLRMIASRLQV